MIRTEKLNKFFGSTQALKGVSFEIQKGEIVGFLGRNGAGKTTLMRILTSYLPASSGAVTIDGKDVLKDSLAVRRKIGYLPETPPLYPNMTVRDYVRFAAQLKDVPAKGISAQVEKILDQCYLRKVAHRTISVLSKGYQQRVGIAQAIINDPQILILDEPTNGLDPVQIQRVRELIKNLEKDRTVIISTHILSEIEQIAQRVLIIKDGEIVADDALSNLLCDEQGWQQSLEEVFLRLSQ
ncbi:MAG: ATP-binding cassette domain-containing protein [Candidatus Omnitrophica bacterium]|nr:ATP-binding cassette domain-containing protein [Candidatus Omnitrophota bacterium]